jgi:serine phosphatase RsbU (regulator of sigma subunit)
MKEVSSLHKLSRAISVEFEYEKLVKLITEMTAEVIESSKTWLEMYDDAQSRLQVAASQGLSEENIIALNNGDAGSVHQRITESKKTLLINEAAKYVDHALISKWRMQIGSFAGAPLIGANGQVLGILYAAKHQNFGFDPDDVNMLEAYANQAAIALENSKLLKSSFERERMEQELQIAREVQMRLLPQEVPHVRNIQIDTLTITAYEVGGDYYDFYKHNESNLGLIIGDVSGKGTSAAFYMAETKGIIQSLAQIYQSPRDILIQTNKILFRSMEKKSFISLLAASIDCHKNLIRFARAGHCPIIHFSHKDRGTHLHQPEGLAVGIDEGKVFDSYLREHEIALEKGDILAFYTDGLSEAMNTENEEFGEERICEIIRANADLPVSELKETMIDQILTFLDGRNLHDDLTLILIKI